jgi:division protein CdvB (Snf7/Vps24/ESCRT-III family)
VSQQRRLSREFSQPAPRFPRAWRAQMRSEGHTVDREIRTLERSEETVKKEIKKLAKLGEVATARMLAKELVVSKKAKERMYETKARLNSVALQLSEQLATLRMTKAISASNEAMHAMNQLVSVPVVAASMREMARQMEKAGFIQEIIGETLDGQTADLEDAADEEVERVLEELTAGLVLPDAAKNKLEKEKAEAARDKARAAKVSH